ncbi:unnamed protein product [Staurois parvus]|uniref:Uncharacterized protein n=1 Tax=Staurois parvus TaxID=386267 RepID=A0ABN9BQV4_9NEOB|nr:unnamed protein product [Staurois parvus]
MYMPAVQSGNKRWSLEKGEEQKRKDQTAFLHNAEPLGSTVSITSMLYYIYRLILLLWV